MNLSIRTSIDDELDLVFAALANQTRRSMLARLVDGPCTIGELAEPFAMSLPGASKHLRVLERAGLVKREVDGRIHRCSFQPEPLADAQDWLTRNTQMWEESLDRLGRHLSFESDGDVE